MLIESGATKHNSFYVGKINFSLSQKIPNFLKNYTSNDYNKEKISFHSVIRTLSQSENEDTNNINYNYNVIVENQVEEEEDKNEEENENLILLDN